MKLHLNRILTFKFTAARVLSVLVVAVLTISTTFLGSIPVHAQAAIPVPLQCQVSSQVGSNGISYSILCNGTIPGGSVVLNCQSPNAISDNNGVFTVAGSCAETIQLAGVSIPATASGTGVTINANNGSITVAGGTVTLTENDGLASATETCSGAALTETLSPLTLNDPGTCTVATSLLGIGTAQITATGGSTIDVTNSPNPTITINSPDISASASLLGLITANLACGSSVTIDLNKIFPIAVPLPICTAS